MIVNLHHIYVRIALMIPLILLFSGLLILTDSLYYGELSLTKLWELTMDWNDWKVAPFNFIMYNLVPGNVASHGESLDMISSILTIRI